MKLSAPLSALLALGLLAPGTLAQLGSTQVARVHPEPNELALADDFGAAVDVHGVTLIVGAPWHDPAGVGNGGAAYVFDLVGAALVQTVKLTPSSLDEGDRAGAAVALHGDTAVVGAPFDEEGPVAAVGSAVVYARTNGVWTEQARLVASDAEQIDQFGSSVGVDGDTLVAGAPFADGPAGLDTGAAYVFVRAGTTWTEQAVLAPLNAGASDRFGHSVTVSGDRIAVGAPRASGAAGARQGAVYVFERTGTTWAEVAALTAADAEALDELGTSVAIDGTSVVAGAPFDKDPNGTNAGAAYVFVDDGSGWSQQVKLSDPGAVFHDRFGTSVDIEGDRAVVGLPYNGVGGLATGSVQVFTRTADQWTYELELIGSESDPNDFLGTAVALSGDLVVGGAPSGETPPTELPTGEAYLFGIVPPPLIEAYCTAKVSSQGCVPSMSWTGQPSATNPSPFEVIATNVPNYKSGLLFYGFAPHNGNFQGGTKCVASPTRRTPIQFSFGSVPPVADCSGRYTYDMNARLRSGVDPSLVPGADVYCQYWLRDPASPSTTGLSDGLHFRVVP